MPAHLSMVGSDSNPMVTTVAPTIPVLADQNHGNAQPSAQPAHEHAQA
jgi:hypothetical protein